MSDNPLDRIPSHDRVSVRAVLVRDGEDPGPALTAAGIADPIALPVMFGEGQPDVSFGDGFTANLTAVLEPDQAEDDVDPSVGEQGYSTDGYDPAGGPDDAGTVTKAGSAGGAVPAARLTTTSLPSAYGLQPLAPVRRPG
jgi:hypothetical protein